MCRRFAVFWAVVLLAIAAATSPIWLFDTEKDADYVSAAATILLGVAAVFQDRIRAHLYGPRLEVEVLGRDSIAVTGEGLERKEWLCINVHNDGAQAARNVEVLPGRLARTAGPGGLLEPVVAIPPGANFVWSYGHRENQQITLAYLPPDGKRRCDLGVRLLDCPIGVAPLRFCLCPQTVPGFPTELEPGMYYLEVRVEAMNASPASVVIELQLGELTPQWPISYSDKALCIRKVSRMPAKVDWAAALSSPL